MVILTALRVEYNAVRQHLTELHEVVHPQGTIYERGIFAAETATWEVVIVELGPGNETAAQAAERAISYFQPKVILFVGVAGGLKDVQLGDVVAATKIYGYESGKETESFQPRPDIGRTAHRLEQRARAEGRKTEWMQRILKRMPDSAPKVFVEPIVAGEKVIASNKSSTYQFLRSYFSDAVAVEMEGIGVLLAAHANDTPALVVRGISDLVEGKAESDSRGLQETSAHHASAFAFQVLANLVHQNGSRARRQPTSQDGHEPSAMPVRKSVSQYPAMSFPRVPAPQRKANPYATPLPVTGSGGFYGRENVLSEVLDGVFGSARPVSQQVVGLTRSGKTSFLNVLSSTPPSGTLSRGRSQAPDRVAVFVRVDCALLSSNEPSEFWALMYGKLIAALRSRDPATLATLPKGGSGTVHRLADTLKVLVKLGILAVFLLDEFERVVLQLPEQVYQNLRSLLETYPSIACVTATRHELFLLFEAVRHGIYHFPASPLYNVFDAPVEMGTLEDDGAARFIREPSSASGVQFTEEDVEFALVLGGRHPDLTRILCRRLFEYRENIPSGVINYEIIRHQVQLDFLPSARQMVSELLPPERETFIELLKGEYNPYTGYINLYQLWRIGLVMGDPTDSPKPISPIFVDLVDRLTTDS